MAETLSLASPIAAPALTNYAISKLVFDWEGAMIVIDLRGQNGERATYRYNGSKATSLMNALSKANLTVKSLPRHVYEQLSDDGFVVGTVVGTPD